MNKSQVLSGSIVKFHWDGKARNNSDFQLELAKRMNNRLAVVMEWPFWRNERRVQIQSLSDDTLQFAVKWKYLELIQHRPLNNHSEVDNEMNQTDFAESLEDWKCTEKE